MSETFVSLAMVGFFAAFVAFAVWQGGKAMQRTRANLNRLASSLGLTVPETKPLWGIFHEPPVAEGTLRGRAVRIHTESSTRRRGGRKSGRSRTTWAIATVIPAAHGGLTFSLSREGVGARVLGLFGAKEIEVGDRAFDDRWFIQTNQPEYLKAALILELREKFSMLERQGLAGTFELDQGRVTYREIGAFYDESRCQRFGGVIGILEDLAGVAEVWAKMKP